MTALGDGLLRALVVVCSVSAAAAAEASGTVRLGLLPFGTVSWEIDTVQHYGFDRDHGVAVAALPLAHADSGKIALQAGSVDMIVTDWLWVSRQRHDGADFSFFPFSSAVGGLYAPAASALDDVDRLAGLRLGIAGGPLDKSWLLLQAYGRQRFGLALDHAATTAFAAAPLLNQQLRAGRLDAVLTFWHYGARLTAAGYREVIGTRAIVERLGVAPMPALVGYAFRDSWAAQHPGLVEGFSAATLDARRTLAASDDAFERLRPIMQAEDDATFRALRAGFRAGIPAHWGAAEQAAAARLYTILTDAGGAALAGAGSAIAPGTFYPGVSY
ncbi:MAG: ABC transporter substrate-binding protein [Azospirillum sp.]|nr:ABC transporter substrate-binding protein [Azospirillum sp.]